MRLSLDFARGRWREILPKLGIPPESLRNRHGPCPICGGRWWAPYLISRNRGFAESICDVTPLVDFDLDLLRAENHEQTLFVDVCDLCGTGFSA